MENELIAPRGRELWLGLIYLPIHVLGLPLLLSFLTYRLGMRVTDITYNILYQLVGFLYLPLVMGGYIRRSLTRFMAYGIGNLPTVLIGFGIRYGGSIVVGIIILLFTPEIVNPNNDYVLELVYTNFTASFIMTVILAPVVEEILFRGVIFAPLARRSRALGYGVSMVAFALLHVGAYLVTDFSPLLLLTALAYLPPAFALAWAYERSGSICTSMLLHMSINFSVLLIA